jgi:hypothetical protein
VFVCVHHGRTSRAHQSANEDRRPVRLGANRNMGVDHCRCDRYAARAVARNRTPLGMAEDLAQFARVATLRERPTWAHDAPEAIDRPQLTSRQESSRSLKIAALEHCSELTAAHPGRWVVLVQRGFQATGPVAVSASCHAKLGGQLARETVTRNG